MSNTDCPFCAVIAGRAPARIIARTDRAIAFFPLKPAAFGHTLIAPIEHAEELRDASDVRRIFSYFRDDVVDSAEVLYAA